MAFHECGFSVPAGQFICVVLFEYGLQLQHLNLNNIQQMATFQVMCEGYLGISAHWHLFRYFFKFACLKDGSRVATIVCTNLRMKQGWGDDYIPVTLTSSNNGWHEGWFYLRNDLEFALPAYTGNSIVESRRSWSDDPAKTEQEKMLRDSGWCSDVSEEPGSPQWRWSGNTTPKDSCRSGDDRFVFAR
jgi:hypothetical protein